MFKTGVIMNKKDYLEFLKERQQHKLKQKNIELYIKQCIIQYLIYYYPTYKFPKNFSSSIVFCAQTQKYITINIILYKLNYKMIKFVKNNNLQKFTMDTKYLNQEELENLKQERKLELL